MVVVAPLVDACLQHGLQMRVARVCKIFGSRLVDVVCAVLGLLVYSQFSINYLSGPRRNLKYAKDALQF